jgi:hypothetical protein
MIISLFATHFLKVFGLIFGINVIFFRRVSCRNWEEFLFGIWPTTSRANLFYPLRLKLCTCLNVYSMACITFRN